MKFKFRRAATLVQTFHELVSRNGEDDRAIWKPQGVEPEAFQPLMRLAALFD